MSVRVRQAEREPSCNSSRQSVGQRQFALPEWGGLLAVFFVALVARLAFNFGGGHPDAAFACDASEYLRDAQGVLKIASLPIDFWFSALASLWGAGDISAVRVALSPLRELAIAGPIFPIFIAMCFAIAGQPADYSHSIPPIMGQCLLTSLTCVLVAVIARAVWNTRVALVAGFIAAIYPAFIINSGRLYSESFSCFLTTTVMAICVHAMRQRRINPWVSLVLGITLACLQMTRSVMVILTVGALSVVCLFVPKSARWRDLAITLCGFALVFVPWLCLQKMAFGSASFVVDRAGQYNLFIGTNTQTGGWLSYPYPDGTGIQSKGLPQLVKESIAVSPSRWLRLMLDKPVRLFKMPWNDFKVQVGPLTVATQALFHQLLLLLAAVGAVMAVKARDSSNKAHDENVSRIDEMNPRSHHDPTILCISAVALVHLVYLLFISVPRYNLCAMPSIILFSAFAISAVFVQPSSKSARLLISTALLLGALQYDWLQIVVPWLHQPTLALAAVVGVKILAVFNWLWCVVLFTRKDGRLSILQKILVAASGLIVMVFGCLPLNAHGRCFEWQAPLTSDKQISRQVLLSEIQVQRVLSSHAYLLIDVGSLKSFKTDVAVKINGVALNAPVVPLAPFVQDLSAFKLAGQSGLYLEFEDILRGLVASADKHLLDVRQWALIPLDSDVLRRSLTAAGDCKLDVTLDAVTNNAVTIYGGYSKGSNRLTVPSIDRYSWEKAFYGVENNQGLSDLRYDRDVSVSISSREKASGIPFVLLLSGTPKSNGSIGMSTLRTSSRPLSGDQTVQIDKFASYAKDDLWLVRLRGKARSTKAQTATTNIAIQATSQVAGDKSKPTIAANVPESAIGWGSNAGAFKPIPGACYEYSSPWATRTLNVGAEWQPIDIAFPLQPSGMPGRLQTIKGTLSDAPGLKVDDLQLDVYLMPGYPTGIGYEVF